MRSKSAILFLIFALCNAIVFAQGADPVSNPADLPWPQEDKTPCLTNADKAMDIVYSVTSSCVSRGGEKFMDYVWITGHLVAGLAIPGMGEVVVGELTKKLGKDVTVCVLTGLVDGFGGSPDANAATKATIEAIFETQDRAKYLKNVSKVTKHLKDSGVGGLMDDKDHAKFLSFIDKKTYDRKKNLTKELDALQATGQLITNYFDTPDRKAKREIVEAEDLIKSCEFEKAAKTLAHANIYATQWLVSIRENIVARRKEIRCKEEIAREESKKPTHPEFGRSSIFQELEYARAELPAVEQKEREQVQYLQELATWIQETQKKQNDVNELRKKINLEFTEAQAFLDGCDWSKAAGSIDTVKQYATGWCGTLFTEEFTKANQILTDIEEKKQQQKNDEKRIADLYKEATSIPKSSSCSQLSSAADSIESIQNKSCVNALEASVKVKSLRNMVQASIDAAQEAQGFFAGGNEYIKKCDPMGVDAMADAMRNSFSKMFCIPTGQGVPTEASAAALEQQRDGIVKFQKEMAAKTDQLLQEAKDAATHCDQVRLNAKQQEIANLQAEYAQACPMLPQGVAEKIAEIQKLRVKDPKEALEARDKGNAALKNCDPSGARQAADALSNITNACGFDVAAEAARLRSEADGLDREMQNYISNVSLAAKALEEAARACKQQEAQLALAEMNRIADANTCPNIPPSVGKTVQQAYDEYKKMEAGGTTQKLAADTVLAGEQSLKKCEPQGARQAADTLISISPAPCGFDVMGQATRLRNAAAELDGRMQSYLSNVTAAAKTVEGAVQACKTHEAQVALAEMNRIADSNTCPNIPASAGKIVQDAFDKYKHLESLAASEKLILDSYNEGEKALAECDDQAALSAFKKAVHIFQTQINNPNCPIIETVRKAQAGAVKAENISRAYAALESDLQQALQDIDQCLLDFNATVDRLNRAQEKIRELQRIAPACDVSQEAAKIAGARATINRVTAAREQINNKIVGSRGYFHEALKNNPPKALELAKNSIEEAKSRYEAANAQDDGCFDHQRAEIEDLEQKLQQLEEEQEEEEDVTAITDLISSCDYEKALGAAQALEDSNPLHSWLVQNMDKLEELASSQKQTRQLLQQAQSAINAKDLEGSLNIIEQARTSAPSCMADQIQKMIDEVNTMLTNFKNATNRAASASNACDFDGAMQAAQEAQSISPQHSWVRENVSRIQALASKKQQARNLIQQAVTNSQSATTPDHWDAVIATLEQARSTAPSCLIAEIDSLIAAAREKKSMKPRVEKSIVLLIDTSGSMADNNKIANAKIAAGQAVRKLGPATEVAILAFSGDCSSPVRVAHQFSNDSNSLIQAIEGLSPGGGTPMAPALGIASQFMQQNGRGKSGEIILMCDGQNDCGSVQDATNGVRTSTIPTNVSTIGFDIPSGSQADQDLRSIASQTGGRNYSASNSKELIHAFSRALLLNAIKRDDPSFSNPAVGTKVRGLFDMAQSSLQRNDFPGALTQYKQAYDLAPNSPGVNYNLSIVYEELDQLTPSVSHAEKYLALAPNAFDTGDVQARIGSMKRELATNPREILDPTGCRDLYFWAKSQDQKKVKDPAQKALLFEILISAQKGDCVKARDSQQRYMKSGG